MSTPLTIEEESGTSTGTRHRHNGYYAGDFFAVPAHPPTRPHGELGVERCTQQLTARA